MLKKREERGRVNVVVGMQYGSEGKGAITQYLAPAMSIGVRTGAANAGHTIYAGRRKFIMRQLPSVWVNPYAQLVIGRGAMISPDILFQEIAMLEEVCSVHDRLHIDRDAHVITEDQQLRENRSDLGIRIGSTSALSNEGIGEATADKVLRKDSCMQAKNVPALKPFLCDTVDMINSYLDSGDEILLEGTQGLGLSLEHGTFPYVTSRDVSASAMAASVGIGLHHFTVDVIGVVRTYPIRVAGNSGPFGEDSQEISWEELTRRTGSPRAIHEQTSVTKKLRRVATFSKKDLAKAASINRPTEIALTFADYLDWTIHNTEKITKPVEQFREMVEEASGGVQVAIIKTGPRTCIDFDWYRSSMLRKLDICYNFQAVKAELLAGTHMHA